MIFGGTGDLSRRKILPALFQLVQQQLSPEKFLVVGVARDQTINDASFRTQVNEALNQAGISQPEVAAWCNESVFYQTIGKGTSTEFAALAARLRDLERAHDLPGNRAVYIALPPDALPPTISGLAEAGLNRSDGWTRIVIEKPFGHDLNSARDLNQMVHRWY